MGDPEDLDVEQAVRDTENQIMDEAFAEEPPKEPPAPPEPPSEPPVEEVMQRARDPETGRFTRTAPAPSDESEAQSQGPDEEKPTEQVPSWRLREIAEERRQIQAERDQLRADNARMQAYLAQFQRQQAPPQAPPPIDPVLDPQGFARQVREDLRSEFMERERSNRLETNLEMAHMRHGERFERAYEALILEGQRGNNQLVRTLVAQPNPGAAIVDWFNRNEVMREVGSDIPGFKQRTREQLLNDPEFLAEAAERARAYASGGMGQAPRTVTRLPPSLARATGNSASESPDGQLDGSDEGIFAYALNSRPRR
jgi:hypothetical protein